MVLLYVIVVLQGIIHNSVFALRWLWVDVCYHLEIIRLKTNDGYIKPSFLKYIIKYCLITLINFVFRRKTDPFSKVMYNQLKSHSAIIKLISWDHFFFWLCTGRRRLPFIFLISSPPQNKKIISLIWNETIGYFRLNVTPTALSESISAIHGYLTCMARNGNEYIKLAQIITAKISNDITLSPCSIPRIIYNLLYPFTWPRFGELCEF